MANTRPCRTFHSHLVNWTLQPFYYLMLCFALLLPLTFPLCLSLVVVCLGGKRICCCCCCCGKFFAKAECENVDVGGGMCVPTTMVSQGVCLSVCQSVQQIATLAHAANEQCEQFQCNFDALFVVVVAALSRGYLQVCVGLRIQ